MIAWRTGAAWGFTETRSGARMCSNQSEVMMLTIDADEAWWPPTFTPDSVFRTLFAWWTIEVASHRTRDSTDSSTSRSTSPGARTPPGRDRHQLRSSATWRSASFLKFFSCLFAIT